MTPADAARVLAKCAAYDNRTVGQSNAMAWAEAMPDIDLDEALEAVSRHYRENDFMAMPAHIRRQVDQVRRDRRIATRAALPVADHPTDPRPLTDRRPEIREFIAQVRGALPETGPDVLHPRAAGWRREHAIHHERTDADPNPNFDPSMITPVEWNRSAKPPERAWWQDDTARERHAVEELAKAGRLRSPR